MFLWSGHKGTIGEQDAGSFEAAAGSSGGTGWREGAAGGAGGCARGARVLLVAVVAVVADSESCLVRADRIKATGAGRRGAVRRGSHQRRIVRGSQPVRRASACWDRPRDSSAALSHAGVAVAIKFAVKVSSVMVYVSVSSEGQAQANAEGHKGQRGDDVEKGACGVKHQGSPFWVR